MNATTKTCDDQIATELNQEFNNIAFSYKRSKPVKQDDMIAVEEFFNLKFMGQPDLENHELNTNQ